MSIPTYHQHGRECYREFMDLPYDEKKYFNTGGEKNLVELIFLF